MKINIPFKRTALLLSLIILPTFADARSDWFGLGKGNVRADKTSYIEYDGVRYFDTNARIFSHNDGKVSLSLGCLDPTDKKMLYEFFVDFKNGLDNTATVNFELSPDNNESPDMRFLFIRNYTQWNGAYHLLKAREGNIYFQKFGDEDYLLCGGFTLDTRGAEQVTFIHYGRFVPDVVEVKRIVVMNGSDIDNNEGEMYIDSQQVETAYGYYCEYLDNYRFYVTDRLLMRDRALEYGIFLDHSQWRLPAGTYRHTDTDGLKNVGFFDRDTTIIPEQYEIRVEYDDRKNDYKINYNLTLPDQRAVKGHYRGRLAELQL